jgi:hypothetical protein
MTSRETSGRARLGVVIGVLAILVAAALLALFLWPRAPLVPPPPAVPAPPPAETPAPIPPSAVPPPAPEAVPPPPAPVEAPPAPPPAEAPAPPRGEAHPNRAAAWPMRGLPPPPAGWLEAGALAAAMPCARLEAEGDDGALRLRIMAADPVQGMRLQELAAAVPGAVATDVELVEPGSAVCRVLDLLSSAGTLASPDLAVRVEPPTDAACARPPCYQGVAARRLAEGERLVLAITAPPVASHLIVDYLTADGKVAHLYPPPSPVTGAVPGGAYGLPTAPGEQLWIGDRRAGPVYTEYPVGAPFGRELVLAVAAAAPLFAADRPAVETAEGYLAELAQALAAASAGARPIASLVPIETRPAGP